MIIALLLSSPCGSARVSCCHATSVFLPQHTHRSSHQDRFEHPTHDQEGGPRELTEISRDGGGGCGGGGCGGGYGGAAAGTVERLPLVRGGCLGAEAVLVDQAKEEPTVASRLRGSGANEGFHNSGGERHWTPQASNQNRPLPGRSSHPVCPSPAPQEGPLQPPPPPPRRPHPRTEPPPGRGPGRGSDRRRSQIRIRI